MVIPYVYNCVLLGWLSSHLNILARSCKEQYQSCLNRIIKRIPPRYLDISHLNTPHEICCPCVSVPHDQTISSFPLNSIIPIELQHYKGWGNNCRSRPSTLSNMKFSLVSCITIISMAVSARALIWCDCETSSSTLYFTRKLTPQTAWNFLSAYQKSMISDTGPCVGPEALTGNCKTRTGPIPWESRLEHILDHLAQ